ncbi:hypothetical protein AJ79_02774 [Helicocarpus griseus UAMH5409]|uniref:Uncharacterized protein n=1 Tax=Helicocarpus griseus UAMH5409 TaxID=1447875 RepID=A0A2B7Y1J7_9EURO|nr:hypothetical protein AJ79_02774 [Helicocarpus griseus UAMH5409]
MFRALCPRFAVSELSCFSGSASLRCSAPSSCQFFFPSPSSKRHASTNAEDPKLRPILNAPVSPQRRIPQTLAQQPTKSLEILLKEFNREISINKKPTKLYEPASMRSYIATNRTTAAFCYFYAGWNFYTTAADPLIEVSTLTSYLMGGVCVLMGAMGTIFLRRASNLVSGITAHPTSNNIPEIRIKVRRSLGFLKDHEIVTSPAKVSISNVIFAPKYQIKPQDMKRIREALREQRTAGQRISFWKTPMRKISHLIFRAAINMRRAFTQEGFVYLQVEGVSGSFRVDMTGIFGDEFLSFERYLAHKPN